MYYWNTKKLAEAIKEGNLQEQDKKNYYLAITIVMTIFMYIAIGGGTKDSFATMVECICLIGIVIFGIDITFKTNRANEGTDYIARITLLSLPILIKLVLLSFGIGILVGIASGVVGNTDLVLSQWFSTFMAIVIQVLFFWRVNEHLKFINA